MPDTANAARVGPINATASAIAIDRPAPAASNCAFRGYGAAVTSQAFEPRRTAEKALTAVTKRPMCKASLPVRWTS